MSDDGRRRGAKTGRRFVEECEAAALARRFVEWEMRTVRSELAALKDLVRLHGAIPRPGQAYDSFIEEIERKFTKSGRGMARYAGRVTRLTRAAGGLLVEATVSNSVTVEAVDRASRQAVNQNMDKSQRAAGILLSGAEAAGSRTTVSMLITDETAALKATRGIYPCVVIAVEDGEVDEISLVDTPSEFLSKASGGAQVICKVFERGARGMREPVRIYTRKYLRQQRELVAAELAKRARGEVLRKAPPSIPASAELALAEWSDARKAMVEGPGDMNLRRSRMLRAETALGTEMIKAAQNRGPSRDPRLSFKF
jgi:hypothetical protein